MITIRHDINSVPGKLVITIQQYPLWARYTRRNNEDWIVLLYRKMF